MSLRIIMLACLVVASASSLALGPYLETSYSVTDPKTGRELLKTENTKWASYGQILESIGENGKYWGWRVITRSEYAGMVFNIAGLSGNCSASDPYLSCRGAQQQIKDWMNLIGPPSIYQGWIRASLGGGYYWGDINLLVVVGVDGYCGSDSYWPYKHYMDNCGQISLGKLGQYNAWSNGAYRVGLVREFNPENYTPYIGDPGETRAFVGESFQEVLSVGDGNLDQTIVVELLESPQGMQVAYPQVSQYNELTHNAGIELLWTPSREQAGGEFVATLRVSDPEGATSVRTFTISVEDRDYDADGVFNESDNCPSIPNPDQADLDGDNVGDACDADIDGDSVEDTLDNCPLVANADQLDVDGDLIGDACDDLIDNDADGIANDLDNCPAVPNADQADNDGDLQGDACDLDDDNDGVEDTVDNCSLTANENQADNDSDNIGDACDSDDDNDAIEDDLDNCPLIANVSQDDNDGDGFGDVCDPDDDNDVVDDSVDNCPLSFNPDQSNTDGVGAGDACNDAFDLDDDDWENDYDNCPDVANRNQSDFDYDNIGDACDSDVDGDEVANAADACELTPLGDLVGSIGCSIEQLCPCDAPRQSTDPWKNHGQYVSCMTKAAQSFAADGVISDNEKSDLVNAAAQSSCGY